MDLSRLLLCFLSCLLIWAAPLHARVQPAEMLQVGPPHSALSEAKSLQQAEASGLRAADLPPAALQTMEALNVRNADLRDVLRALAAQHGLNLIVDDRIEHSVTVRLSNLPVIDALIFLCREYGLALERSGEVFTVRTPEPVIVQPSDLKISVSDGLMTVDLAGADLQVVVRAFAEKSGKNVIVRQGVTGTVSGFLQNVPLKTGLETILRQNGFSLYENEKDGIHLVDRLNRFGDEAGASSSFRVQVSGGRVDLEVAGAGVMDVVREIARQMDLDLVTYATTEGLVTAKWSKLGLEESLGYLLKGTELSHRLEGGMLVVGTKNSGGVTSTKLIRLNHIRPEGLLERLPEHLRRDAAFQVIKEQNGIVVTGSVTTIQETEEFLRQIDEPTPQIFIEALVVDFETTDLKELGVTFGRNSNGADPGAPYVFGGGDDQSGGLELRGDGARASGYLDFVTDLLGRGSIGRLPADFFFRLRALEVQGKANVRSRPQIATLNGHTASISVGTTQYYILKSILPMSIPGQPLPTETERFERVEANVTLEITPWVTASGEVTAEINPEFATPVGMLDPRIPPSINNRVVHTTVRLKDGETVIIGGLIQENQSVIYNKIPLLGDIPLLGRLFRSRRHDTRKSELVIFITPHVFYGDERDQQKWDHLKKDLGLSGGGRLNP